MSRELTDWITTYLKYTENSEPPRSYHIWTAISLIAAALQRKVYMKWGFDKIFPNMYIVLVGPSGKCRKGTAMNIGKEILKDVGVPMTSESVTREALIRAMQRSTDNYQERSSGRIVFHCSLTCHSDELSVFLGQNDVKFLSTLTDWYDSRDIWRYETKGGGTDEIKGVCFNLLGATAPDWFQSILPQEAIGGGFTSRVIFVSEEDKEKTVAEHILTDEEKRMREALRRDLERISILAGEVTFSKEAKAAYVDWYTEEEKKIEAGQFPVADQRFAGYSTRRATHIKKLSMILSMSRDDSMEIQLEDFERAKSVLTAVERKMHNTFGGLGQAQYSEITEKVLTFLTAVKTIKRSDLMKRFYRDMDTETLKVVENVLVSMKVMRVKLLPEQNDAIYEFRGPEK